MIDDNNHTKKLIFTIFAKGFSIGILGLTSFYYLLLFLVTKDFLHPFRQFELLQPWMSLLIIGFGIQSGLFWLMRSGVQFSIEEKKDASLATGTGTAISGIAMIACCAHHIIEFLPILGLSAAALFLTEYQEEFLIIGVLSNLFGIIMMLWFITGKEKPQTIINLIRKKL